MTHPHTWNRHIVWDTIVFGVGIHCIGMRRIGLSEPSRQVYRQHTFIIVSILCSVKCSFLTPCLLLIYLYVSVFTARYTCPSCTFYGTLTPKVYTDPCLWMHKFRNWLGRGMSHLCCSCCMILFKTFSQLSLMWTMHAWWNGLLPGVFGGYKLLCFYWKITIYKKTIKILFCLLPGDESITKFPNFLLQIIHYSKFWHSNSWKHQLREFSIHCDPVYF